jgi:hypothetical protein
VFGVSLKFNISDLQSYLGEEDEIPSRMTSIHEGEDDEGITTSDTTTPSNYEITSRKTKSSGN